MSKFQIRGQSKEQRLAGAEGSNRDIEAHHRLAQRDRGNSPLRVDLSIPFIQTGTSKPTIDWLNSSLRPHI